MKASKYCIIRALSHNGLSKLRICVTLLRATCSLTYIMMEYMHVMSPGSMSNMGKNNMEDFPGWLPILLIICIKPDHAGLGDLILNDISQSRSTLVRYSVWYSTNLSYCIGQRPSTADTKWWMLIRPIKAISLLVLVTVTRRCTGYASCYRCHMLIYLYLWFCMMYVSE